MMTEAEALTRLRPILADILVLNEEEVEPTRQLVDDLDADSVAFLELNYRLQQDFGLIVPRPKVTEEMLGMPLPEGMSKMHSLGIEPTMLEYMTGEMLHHGREDPDVHRLMIDQFRRTIAGPEFKDDLRAALKRSLEDESTRQAFGRLKQATARTPGLAPLLEQALADDLELAASWVGLAVAPEGDPPADAAPDELSVAWFRVFNHTPAQGSLTGLNAGQLARFMGTGVPVGIAPELSLAELRVRDLFRFITVASYVRYLVFLSGSQGAAPTA